MQIGYEPITLSGIPELDDRFAVAMRKIVDAFTDEALLLRARKGLEAKFQVTLTFTCSPTDGSVSAILKTELALPGPNSALVPLRLRGRQLLVEHDDSDAQIPLVEAQVHPNLRRE